MHPSFTLAICMIRILFAADFFNKDCHLNTSALYYQTMLYKSIYMKQILNIFIVHVQKLHRCKAIVVCRFIGAFKNAHKWANYRYVERRSRSKYCDSSPRSEQAPQMDIFQR